MITARLDDTARRLSEMTAISSAKGIDGVVNQVCDKLELLEKGKGKAACWMENEHLQDESEGATQDRVEIVFVSVTPAFQASKEKNSMVELEKLSMTLREEFDCD